MLKTFSWVIRVAGLTGFFSLLFLFQTSSVQAGYEYASQITGLYAPFGVTIDVSGNVYVANYNGDVIKKFNSSGVYQSQFGSSGGGNGQFNHPISVAIDGNGNYFVLDQYNQRVQKFDSSGIYQSQFGGFRYPSDIKIDQGGNVYIADTHNHRIQKFDSAGVYQSTIGSNGSGNGQFSYPQGVAVDGSGNVYVADTFNNRIQKFNSAGVYQFQFGSSGGGNGQFNRPTTITLDVNGNIYVLDSYNRRVQKFNSSGVYLTQFGSYGSGNGQFINPYGGLAIDGSGNVYVCDYSRNNVQKFLFSPATVSSSTLSVPEGTSKSYTVVLDSQPTDDVTIALTASDPITGLGVTLYPSTLTFTSSNWNTPQTVTVSALSDPDTTGTRTVTISSVITSMDNNFNNGYVSEVTVTLFDQVNITTCTELQAMQDHLDSHYTLTADIDCAGFDPNNDGTGFIPVGTQSTPFTGVFEGNGHTISNLSINRPATEYVGLFGYINNSGTDTTTIDHLTLSGSIEGKGYVGAIAGYINSSAIIDHVTSSASVTGHGNYVGGLVGYTNSTLLVRESHFTSTISIATNSNAFYVGGFVGYASGYASIVDSDASGSITSTTTAPIGNMYYFGGFMGYSGSSSLSIVRSHSAISMSLSPTGSAGYTGGLAGGVYDNTSIVESYTTGNISSSTVIGSLYSFGGLVGNAQQNFDINSSYASGDITLIADSSANSGGLVGYASNVNITDGYYSGNLHSTAAVADSYGVGGLIGYTGSSNILNSHATGTLTVSAGTNAYSIGGLIGNVSQLLMNDSYATNSVNVTSGAYQKYVGGLVGSSNGSDINKSYSTGTLTLDAGSYIDSGVGGLMGYTNGVTTLAKSYSSSPIIISANTYIDGVGGLLGYTNNNTIFNDTFAKGGITVTSATSYIQNIGGLVGYKGTSFANSLDKSYAVGSVTLNASTDIANVGGLLASADATDSITNSWSATPITLTAGGTTTYTGGLIGKNASTALSNNFYDATLTTQALCTGSNNPNPSGCTPITANSPYFKGNSTNPPFASWDFTKVWETIDSQYPTLMDLPSPYPILIPPALSFTLSYTITTNTKPTFVGTAEDDLGTVASVEFKMDAEVTWNPCTPSDGTFDQAQESFQCTPTTALTEGSHTIYIRATDDSNNTTQEGNYLTATFTVNTQVTPTMVLSLTNVTNTDNNKPTFEGTAIDDIGTVAGVSFVADDTNASWDTCTATDGNFNQKQETFACTPSSGLSNGTHTVYFRATDNAGNTTLEADYLQATITVQTDTHNKYYKQYKEYKKYKTGPNKTAYLYVKALKRTNPSEFDRLKGIYDTYRPQGNAVILALPQKTQTDYNTYKKYLNYKRYLLYKEKAGV